MYNIKIPKEFILRQNIFEEFPKGRNVPLAIAKFIHQRVFGVYLFDLEHSIERLIGRHHTKVFIEYEHWFPYDIYYRLNICPVFLAQTLNKMNLSWVETRPTSFYIFFHT